VAIGADLVGRLVGSESLREAGRHIMPLAAGAAAASALTGLLAQSVVEADGPAHRALVAHRSINLGVGGASVAMAAWRWRRRSPSAGYLAAGLAALALVTYSAYLGSKMVYEYGVGVDAAGGTRAARGASGRPAAALRTAAGDRLRGLPSAPAPVPLS
jgi:uncharacterized membrane protein